MKYIYPLGRSSRWANNELRYSLRSIGDKEVVVIGDQIPSWFKGQKLKVGDPYNKKQTNVIRKLQAATKYAEPFVVMNDDFFQLKDEIKNWCTIDLKEKVKGKAASSVWTKSMINTLEWLEKKGLPTFDYTLHVPYIVSDLDKFKYCCKEALEGSDVYSLRSMYLNMINEPEVIGGDVKIISSMSKQAFELYIQGKSWFSISDKFLTVIGKEIIMELYQTKSKYE